MDVVLRRGLFSMLNDQGVSLINLYNYCYIYYLNLGLPIEHSTLRRSSP